MTRAPSRCHIVQSLMSASICVYTTWIGVSVECAAWDGYVDQLIPTNVGRFYHRLAGLLLLDTPEKERALSLPGGVLLLLCSPLYLYPVSFFSPTPLLQDINVIIRSGNFASSSGCCTMSLSRVYRRVLEPRSLITLEIDVSTFSWNTLSYSVYLSHNASVCHNIYMGRSKCDVAHVLLVLNDHRTETNTLASNDSRYID